MLWHLPLNESITVKTLLRLVWSPSRTICHSYKLVSPTTNFITISNLLESWGGRGRSFPASASRGDRRRPVAASASSGFRPESRLLARRSLVIWDPPCRVQELEGASIFRWLVVHPCLKSRSVPSSPAPRYLGLPCRVQELRGADSHGG